MGAFKLLIAGIGMGWGPCLAQLGPIILPYIAATKGGWRQGFGASGLFCLGRLAAVAILGGLAAVAFAQINRFFPPHMSGFLYIFIGFFVLLIGLLIVLGKEFRFPLHRILRKHVVERGKGTMLILGFIIGISPCSPLIAILTYIAYDVSGPIQGVIYALFFGAGTAIPIMILGTLASFLPSKTLRSDRNLRAFRVVCGAILMILGFQIMYGISQLL